MDLKVTIEIWQKDRWYVARCPELDFVSQGLTQSEARRNLLELIQIQFEEMTALGTLEDYLLECEKTGHWFHSQKWSALNDLQFRWCDAPDYAS
jgi:predicted RNase H-like HicB family nuclease